MIRRRKCLLSCNGEPFDVPALFPLLAVYTGTFFILGEFLLSGLCIAVDLPAAGAFAAVRTVVHKALNILGGIAQEQTDLVRELCFTAELTGKLPDTPLAALRGIALGFENPGGSFVGQIFAELAGAVEVNQGFGLRKPERQHPKPLFAQPPVDMPERIPQSLFGLEGAGEQISGFDTCQRRGSVSHDVIFCHGNAPCSLPGGVPGKLLQPGTADLNHDNGADGTHGLDKLGDIHTGSSLLRVS